MQNLPSFIVGIGTDIVQVPRIEKLYAKFGEKFLNKNYHELEIKDFWKLNKDYVANKNKIWGYITNSGTEGNLQGLFVGRESALGQSHVFLTSKDSHFSLFKIEFLII